MKYANVGVHFFASVDESENLVWNGETWAHPWDTDRPPDAPELEGKSFHERFDTATEAKNFINTILAREFSADMHEPYDYLGFGQIVGFKWDWAEDFDPNGDEW